MQVSQVLHYAPHLFSPTRINASSRYVTNIDTLPAIFQAAKTVYLSTNFLSSLRGVDQFFAVEVLSLAHNRLRRIEDLAPLHACLNLKSLYLEGNPLAKLPFYRTRVVALLGSRGIHLESLDGTGVGAHDYEAALQLLHRHAAALAFLLSQECRIVQLSIIAQMIPVHRQLLSRAHGTFPRPCGATAPPQPIDFCLDVILR